MGSMRARWISGISLSLLLASAAPPSAQKYTSMVGTIGADTVAVDRYQRNDTLLEGVVLVRRPAPHTMTYKAALAPGSRFSAMEIVWRNAAGVELRSARISFGTDSIRSEIKEGAVRTVGAAAALDAIPLPPTPYSPHCYALLEHAAIVLLMAKQPGMTSLEWITAGTRKAEKRMVRRSVGDTIQFDYLAGPVRLLPDSTKRVTWISIGTLPRQTIVQRSADDINIAKLLASFASRDLR